MNNQVLSAILLGSAVLRPELSMTQESPLNILLFTADDLDRNSLGCYGSEVADISPNVDRFASEGIRFVHAYVNNSISQPSRGILATGLYGHNSGVMGFMKMQTGSPLPVLMEILGNEGYITGVFGKVEHSTPKPEYTWDRTVYQDQLGNGRSPSLYYEHVKDFLDSCRQNGKPFYCMVNSHDPHRPFFNPDLPLRNGWERPSRIYSPEEVPVPGFLPDLPLVRQEISYYYNSAKRLDDTFGKVMQALDDCGYRENTLVIFMSDNGVAVPFAKCDNYNASNRTPFIVRLPGVIKAGSVDDTHFISEVDYFPTVLEALGIDPPEKLDGVSRWPLFLGKKQKNQGIIFTQIDNKAHGKPMPMRSIATPMRGLQNDKYLYIFNAWANGERIYANNNEGLTMKAMERAAETDPEMAERVNFFRYRTPEEFYDLEKDPHSLNNLIDDPAYAGQIRKMRRSMRKWMKRTDDPLLFIYRNRNNTEKITPRLYEIYPAMKEVDEAGREVSAMSPRKRTKPYMKDF